MKTVKIDFDEKDIELILTADELDVLIKDLQLAGNKKDPPAFGWKTRVAFFLRIREVLVNDEALKER